MDVQSNTTLMSVEVSNTDLWDAFTSHLDTVYFSDASELLDKQTVAFEFELFRSYFS
nr:hypothetical protein [uncultured Draconibacterium sp.]